MLEITVWPLQQQRQEARNKRRVGLGFTGLGDALIMLNLRYDTAPAREMAQEISELMRDTAYEASVELARDIAQKFNNDFAASIAAHGFGEAFFPLPEPIYQGPGARIMSLKDGTKKMSKSDPSDASRINLLDTPDDIAKKIKRATSDSDMLPSEMKGLEGRAEAANLVAIYASLADLSVDQVLAEFGGHGFGKFKPALGELLVESLAPINARFIELRGDREALDAVLAKGALKARELAGPTLTAAYAALGLVR